MKLPSALVLSAILIAFPSDALVLVPRKGGGGGGHPDSSSSGRTTGSSKSNGDGGGGSSPISSGTASISSNFGSRSITTDGGGGGKPRTIGPGTSFSGRSEGGGTRNDIYGSQAYGSGYPGDIDSRGTTGRDFPYVFWPVVYPSNPYWAHRYPYIYTSDYGSSGNSSRPGGPMTYATFIDSNATNNVFLFMADNTTVVSIVSAVVSNCPIQLVGNSSSMLPVLANSTMPDSSILQPEQAVQYYRASSAVLFLDGYNNSKTYSNATDIQDTSLPACVDQSFLNCLNNTIGRHIPLVNGARPFARLGSPKTRALVLLCLGVLFLLVF